MDKTIFRTAKNADNPFVMIDRRVLEDKILSWKAKGVLAYLLSRPDNWETRLQDLVNRSQDGITAIRAAIKELIDAHYIERKEERDKKGKFLQYVFIIHESPLTGFPQADNPQAENLPLNNTDSTNTESNNIDSAPQKNPTPPEIKLYRSITGRYPQKVNYSSIVDIFASVSKRLGRECTYDDLIQFFREWCGRGYNPTNINWTAWAVTGDIPIQGRTKNKDNVGEQLRRIANGE